MNEEAGKAENTSEEYAQLLSIARDIYQGIPFVGESKFKLQTATDEQLTLLDSFPLRQALSIVHDEARSNFAPGFIREVDLILYVLCSLLCLQYRLASQSHITEHGEFNAFFPYVYWKADKSIPAAQRDTFDMQLHPELYGTLDDFEWRKTVVVRNANGHLIQSSNTIRGAREILEDGVRYKKYSMSCFRPLTYKWERELIANFEDIACRIRKLRRSVSRIRTAFRDLRATMSYTAQELRSLEGFPELKFEDAYRPQS